MKLEENQGKNIFLFLKKGFLKSREFVFVLWKKGGEKMPIFKLTSIFVAQRIRTNHRKRFVLSPMPAMQSVHFCLTASVQKCCVGRFRSGSKMHDKAD